MSVASIAIIRKGVNLTEIKNELEKKYSDVNILKSNSESFFSIGFYDGTEKRYLYVSYLGSCLNDYGIDGIWLSLGYSEKSVEILRFLCESFGGYLDENDCDEEGFHPINFHLFKQSKEYSEMDIFINKVISEIGYEHLQKVLLLFEEYKCISFL